MKRSPKVKVLPKVQPEEEPNDPKREAYIDELLRRRRFRIAEKGQE